MSSRNIKAIPLSICGSIASRASFLDRHLSNAVTISRTIPSMYSLEFTKARLPLSKRDCRSLAVRSLCTTLGAERNPIEQKLKIISIGLLISLFRSFT